MMKDLPTHSGLSDEALMLRVKDGDHDAFSVLLDRYERQLFVFFLRQFGDEESARDYVMDTFLRVYRAASRYEPKAKFSTYIYQIARNLAINESRKRDFRRTESLDEMSDESGMQFAGNQLNPAEEMEMRERVTLVQEALRELPEDQRTIIILVEYQELPYEKVAQIMGCSMGTVKSRMHRARQKIREWMESREL
ncbi:sigma-70 family RNA polymerase sigma factor [bacterium]|nr:sigma-70 family RNA polymerase sigma factor [candidate division CSSED10-310 bacterium]